MTVRVEGAARLRRTLRAAGEDLTALKDANRAAADIAARGGQALAPVRSGHIRGTVRAGGTVAAGVVRAGRKSVPYAGPIHWGWPKRGIKPQPFLSLGAQATEPTWLPLFEVHVKTAIQQIKGT